MSFQPIIPSAVKNVQLNLWHELQHTLSMTIFVNIVVKHKRTFSLLKTRDVLFYYLIFQQKPTRLNALTTNNVTWPGTDEAKPASEQVAPRIARPWETAAPCWVVNQPFIWGCTRNLENLSDILFPSPCLLFTPFIFLSVI